MKRKKFAGLLTAALASAAFVIPSTTLADNFQQVISRAVRVCKAQFLLT